MRLDLIADELPSKPSKLIRLGLRDLREVERDARYKVDMNTFHRLTGRVCQVCFAGAVMAKSLGAPRSRNILPHGAESFTCSIDNKLNALDSFRLGLVEKGCEILGIKTHIGNRDITPYDRHKRSFYLDMRKLAADLAAEGN